jgi:putative aminopeptidase FrvX
MTILQQLCATPTAPFAEHHVIDYVEGFVAARKNLRLSHDRWGNLLISMKSAAKGPRTIFAAHMDHPGFVADRMIDAKTLEARFHGAVLAEFFPGTKVRFFTPGKEVAATVLKAEIGNDRGYPERVTLRVASAVAPGSPGMFDLTPGRVTGKEFHSRVCDNLAGAAAALTMIDRLVRHRTKAPVAVLLTRAEEAGFIGALGACASPNLIKKTDRLIIIECSAKQPYAPQGNGAIIRVGDKTSIFNSSLSYFITQTAEKLRKTDKSFKYQRALMPGGTCEATVYDMYGYTAASICVALGNYHNMDRERKKIAAEYINLDDWNNMVKLFVAVAKSMHEYRPGLAVLRERLEKRFARFKPLLKSL